MVAVPVTGAAGSVPAVRIVCLCNAIAMPGGPQASGAGGLGAAGVLGADLPGQSGGVVGVEKGNASCGNISCGQLDLAECPPSAGVADPDRPAGVLLPDNCGGIGGARHGCSPI